GDVLDGSLAEVGVANFELVLDVIISGAGDRYPAGLGQALQPVGDVDAVAMDIFLLDDHIAQVDADAKDEPAILRDVGIAFSFGALDGDRTAQGLDHAGELDQQPIPHGLHEAAAMLGNLRLEDLKEIGLETRAGAFLVDLAEPAIADDVRD